MPPPTAFRSPRPISGPLLSHVPVAAGSTRVLEPQTETEDTRAETGSKHSGPTLQIGK